MVDTIQDEKEQYYQKDKLYSVTLNPVDSSQFAGKSDRLDKFRKRMYNVLLECDIQYDFIIELSEPRGMKVQGYLGPRLHLHGVIKFKNNKQIYKWLMNDYYKLTRISSIDIDTINDLQKWSNYCMKQKVIKRNRLCNEEILIT